MEKRKLKKSVVVSVSLMITAAIICLVILVLNSNTGKTDPAEGNQAQMIQDEGNLEIIIPEDQESEGF